MDPRTPYLLPKYFNKYKKKYGDILGNIIFVNMGIETFELILPFLKVTGALFEYLSTSFLLFVCEEEDREMIQNA